MTWLYHGLPVSQAPQDAIGFVYLITCTWNNKKYIGKKSLKRSKTSYKTVVLKSGEKKRKRIKSAVDSDWLDYWGSSDLVAKDRELIAPEYWTRQILHWCSSKSECNYLEAREQMDRRVLEREDYYNNAIQMRVHGSHILGKLSD